VDGLACSLHYPMICSRHRGDQSYMIGGVPSYQVAVDSGVFLGDVKPETLIFYMVLTVRVLA
jgi:hypothetical protein